VPDSESDPWVPQKLALATEEKSEPDIPACVQMGDEPAASDQLVVTWPLPLVFTTYVPPLNE
jgi:hypothetical protein